MRHAGHTRTARTVERLWSALPSLKGRVCFLAVAALRRLDLAYHDCPPGLGHLSELTYLRAWGRWTGDDAAFCPIEVSCWLAPGLPPPWRGLPANICPHGCRAGAKRCRLLVGKGPPCRASRFLKPLALGAPHLPHNLKSSTHQECRCIYFCVCMSVCAEKGPPARRTLAACRACSTWS